MASFEYMSKATLVERSRSGLMDEHSAMPTECVYMFRMDLRTNSDYIPNSIKWLVFITEI